jgi:manganese-dependent inorganic pyrophosphatase
MQRNIKSFSLLTTVEDARKLMGQVRYNYFPIVNGDGKYCGLISKRNLLNFKRKKLILVDHNERTQCVDGYEEAEILEIIDHHRIGTLETNGPVYFRNQPVGCTNTIIYSMFREQGVEIEPAIAGIMCCAILSDTLAFRSPTCTQLDIDTAHDLAKIANIDPMETAKEMFEAGERLDGKTAEDIVKTDYKIFAHGDTQFGVGQLSFMSPDSLKKAKELILPYLPEMQKKQRLDMVFYMLTSVMDESTETIWAGAAAPETLQKGFGIEVSGNSAVLPGVVSRKKQFIPAVMKALATDEDDVYME